LAEERVQTASSPISRLFGETSAPFEEADILEIETSVVLNSLPTPLMLICEEETDIASTLTGKPEKYKQKDAKKKKFCCGTPHTILSPPPFALWKFQIFVRWRMAKWLQLRARAC